MSYHGRLYWMMSSHLNQSESNHHHPAGINMHFNTMTPIWNIIGFCLFIEFEDIKNNVKNMNVTRSELQLRSFEKLIILFVYNFLNWLKMPHWWSWNNKNNKLKSRLQAFWRTELQLGIHWSDQTTSSEQTFFVCETVLKKKFQVSSVFFCLTNYCKTQRSEAANPCAQ